MEHIENARNTNHTKRLPDAYFMPVDWLPIANCYNAPVDVVAHRLKGRSFLHSLSMSAEPNRFQWKAMPPADSPVKGIRFPITYFIAGNLGFPDKELVRELACGMPIVGIPDAPTLTTRKIAALVSLGAIQAGIPARNATNVERTRRAMGAKLGDCAR